MPPTPRNTLWIEGHREKEPKFGFWVGRIFNTFDFDGVVTEGLFPTAADVVITGRSYDERPVVEARLEQGSQLYSAARPLAVFMNSLGRTNGRTRWQSGHHKAQAIAYMLGSGAMIDRHFDDDALQIVSINQSLGAIAVMRPDLAHKISQIRFIHVDSHHVEK